MKQEKEIFTTFNKWEYTEWPPNDAVGFMEWFQKQLEKVPTEHRPSAHIKLTSRPCYDDSYPSIEISYKRMETDEEEAERERRDTLWIERLRAQELQTLEKLQKKYGVPKT